MIHFVTRVWLRYNHVNWSMLDQIMVSGVNFVTGILLARHLGLEEFGRFTLAWMAILFVNCLQHAAINSPMMSIGPKQSKADAPAYYGAVMLQQVIFSCVICVLLYTGIRLSVLGFPEWRIEDLAVPLAATALASQMQDFLRRYFFTRGRPSISFANDAIRYLGQISVLIYLFMTSGDAVDSNIILWIIAIMATAASLCGVFFVGRIVVNKSTLPMTINRHWHFSKWLTASALMQWSSGNFFIIAAGAILGPTAVGALKAAQNLMGLSRVLLQGLENIVPIHATLYLHNGGKEALLKYLKRISLFGTIVTTAIAAIAAIAPDFWLNLVYGDEYVGYGYLLRFYGAISILYFITFPLRAGLRALEDTRIIFNAFIGMTLATVLSFYPLIKFFGLVGVLIGITTVQLILFSILFAGLKKKLSKIGLHVNA